MVTRYQENNIVFDFDTLFGEWPTDVCNLYRLSQWDVQIILASLRYANWPIRWVDPDGLPLRDTGRVADLRLAVDEIAKTEWRLKVCLEDSITEGLEAIAGAIVTAAETACACAGANGSGGAGQTEDPPDPQDIDNEETEPPPVGFPTWTAYKTQKCNVAGFIVDEMTDDLGRMTTLNFLGLTLLAAVASLAPVLLTPTPVDDVIIIAGIILSAIALGTAVLTSAETLLGDHRGDLVCAIYLGETVADCIDRFNAEVSDKAGADYPAQPLRYYIETVLASMASTDSFNRLTDPDSTQVYPTEDCSSCGVGCGTGEWTVVYGTVTSGDPEAYGTPFTVQSETVGGAYQRLELRRRNAGDTAYTRVRSTLSDLTGWTTYADPIVNLEDTDDCATVNVELFKDETSSAGANWNILAPRTDECCYFMARGNNASVYTIDVTNIEEPP